MGRRIIRIFTILALALDAASARAAAPNIVLIIADDLGYGDLGCFGCEDIATPNIDSIAKEGVRFTNAYAYPTCSPTCASLLTGQYAERFGVSAALMGADAPKFGQAVTVAQVLKQSGYVTALVGKWHLGYTDDVSPIRKGFDEFFGFRGGKIDFYKHTDTAQKIEGNPDGKHDLWEGEKPIGREGYTTDLFTARARQFIRDRAADADAKPFFLFVAYNAPHYGKKNVWQAPDEYLKRFNALGQTKGRDVYRAMVACLDDGVGEILAELRSQALADDTLVIFMSDNGAEPPGSNKPLSGGKHGFKEGGVRVPWLARWPGKIAAGFVREDVVHATDVMPTLLAIAGAKPFAELKFDGRNVWSAFIGGDRVPDRSIYFSNRGLRHGKWKLLNGQLFNLEADLRETTDLAEKYPELRDRLTAESKQWATKIGIEK